MAYQITEKNKILVALFAIVVLCAGKLFKDYLYRGGYIEGLTVVPGTNVPLRRTESGNPLIATLSLNLTLGATLAIGDTITVSWPVTTGVTMPSSSDVTVTGITTNAKPIVTANGTSTLTLTNNGSVAITSGSKIKISMAGVSIAVGTAEIGFNFTTTAGTEPAVSNAITILGSAVATSASSSSTSAQEIRNAISTINTRLSEAGASAPTAADLIKARSALVNVLAYTYGTIQEAGKVFDSDALYEAQKTAITFIAKERERAEKNAKSLSQDNSNKRRMAQVNTYYTRNYEANTEVMKNIIYVSVSLIGLAVIRNKELIPASISTLGVIFILTMGGIVIGKQVFDIMRRNDHEFDKYDWNFNEDDMNKKFSQPSSDPSKSIDLGTGAMPCYGSGCCDTGTTWDSVRGVCAPSGGALSSQGSSAAWTTGTLTITMKHTQALVSGDTVSITLPSGVFAPTTAGGTASIQGTSFTTITKDAAVLGRPIIVTANASIDIAATITLTITDISVSQNANRGLHHNVSVFTSKETTPIPLRISGLPTA